MPRFNEKYRSCFEDLLVVLEAARYAKLNERLVVDYRHVQLK